MRCVSLLPATYYPLVSYIGLRVVCRAVQCRAGRQYIAPLVQHICLVDEVERVSHGQKEEWKQIYVSIGHGHGHGHGHFDIDIDIQRSCGATLIAIAMAIVSTQFQMFFCFSPVSFIHSSVYLP